MTSYLGGGRGGGVPTRACLDARTALLCLHAQVKISQAAGGTAMDPLVASLRSSVHHDLKRKDQLIAGLEEFLYSTDEKERNGARRLMLEFDSASMKKLTQRSKIGDGYLKEVKEASRRVEELFEKSMQSARTGFLVALIMDISVFVVGLILILASVATALAHGVSGSAGNMSWEGTGASGGTGLLAVGYSAYLSDPRKKVKSAVDHVMGIKVRYGIMLRSYRGHFASLRTPAAYNYNA